MSTTHLTPKMPSEKSFGNTVGLILIAIGVVQTWLHAGHGRLFFVAIGALLFTLAWTYPVALVYPNRAWFGLGLLLGKIVSPIVLGVLYYAVVSPFGLFMRVFARHDPLRLSFESDKKTYWVERSPHGPVKENLSRQF